MTKRVKATVNPAVLVWARTSAGFNRSMAASKLNLDEERVEAWENGDDQPTIPQLRRLADLYKRPLAVLYLPEPPMTFQPMHDFRGLPEFGAQYFSPALTLEIRRAQQRRELALEMLSESGEASSAFTLRTAQGSHVDQVAEAIRSALNVDYRVQSSWRDTRVAFLAWRSKIESLGVLVFQAATVERDEASGFAFWADTLPFMVVNRKDAYARRVFSLLHELAHLMLRQSGVSDLDVDAPRSQEDAQIETFCNQVAAATLMPRGQFLAEALIAEKGTGRHEWDDDAIKALATIYSVSREAIVRRLLTLNRTTTAFYQRKRVQYAQEHRERIAAEKAANVGKPIPRNMPRETIANLGRTLVGLVLENYRQDRLSLSEVSGYLGVKTRHLPSIEQQLGFSR